VAAFVALCVGAITSGTNALPDETFLVARA
jgi:hypothetical protein